MDRVITFLTVLLSEVLDHHTTIIETLLCYLNISFKVDWALSEGPPTRDGSNRPSNADKVGCAEPLGIRCQIRSVQQWVTSSFEYANEDSRLGIIDRLGWFLLSERNLSVGGSSTRATLG